MSSNQRVGWVRRELGGLAVLGLLMPLVAGAARLGEADVRAVRQVVESRLGAFAAGDAKRAFSYASPSIRARFGDASRFMAMVQGSYPMVVRPTAALFFLAQKDHGTEAANVTVRQAVQLRDRKGRLWKATYLLERQAGNVWRINGCVVVAGNAKSLT
ncbi:DUF4864 domain-containing protein [Candidatus Accumulibacter contiguus]|jgi:hypothetical protein|uniref:DUF4864 domain-containing protein n=2 Tax=Betaproteobacteria incertae sedis TaxID=119066 RepID=A0ABX1TBJ2_9PROT|nr:DUF4864 domain-containing protein [Candidatus Accumulibacter contiguus]